jgi:hypothetical protein
MNETQIKETSPKGCVRQLSLGELRFNGSDYKPEVDNPRLVSQLDRIVSVMQDRRWRTLSEIEKLTGDPQASISAQLRHLRKPRFGSHTVNKRPRGDRERGLFEYQLVLRGEGHESSA